MGDPGGVTIAVLEEADGVRHRWDREQESEDEGPQELIWSECTLPDKEKDLDETGEVNSTPKSGECMDGSTEGEPHPLLGGGLTISASGPTSKNLMFFAHHLPVLTSFKGDNGPDTETNEEWLEHLNMLTEECRWTASCKAIGISLPG